MTTLSESDEKARGAADGAVRCAALPQFLARRQRLLTSQPIGALQAAVWHGVMDSVGAIS